MSCEEAVAQALKDSGHRLTPQRLMILTVLRHAEGHLTAAEILDHVKGAYPYVDVSTVYRTLHLMKDMRLVSETDMGDGEQRYEWVDRVRHHHLICKSCDAEIQLDHKYLKALAAEILADYSFQADIDHIGVFGLCEDCRRRSEG